MAVQPKEALEFSSLKLSHIPYVLHVERDAYPEPWTYEMLRQELDNPNAYFCLMHLEGALVGYGGFWLLVDEAHITRVTILSDRRGQGLSKHLMAHLLEQAVIRGALEARLEVRENNAVAINLYRALDFAEEGRRLGYYRNTNENAIVMARKLVGSGA